MEDKESGPVSLKVASKDQTTEVFIMKSWKKVVGAVCMTTLVAAAVAGCSKSGGKSGGGDAIKVGALFEHPPSMGSRWLLMKSMPRVV